MKADEKWRTARKPAPCEACKNWIEPGEFYWGPSHARTCFDCAYLVATVAPPVLHFTIARYRPEGYVTREFIWPTVIEGMAAEILERFPSEGTSS